MYRLQAGVQKHPQCRGLRPREAVAEPQPETEAREPAADAGPESKGPSVRSSAVQGQERTAPGPGREGGPASARALVLLGPSAIRWSHPRWAGASSSLRPLVATPTSPGSTGHP